jgi:hypothetical protein
VRATNEDFPALEIVMKFVGPASTAHPFPESGKLKLVGLLLSQDLIFITKIKETAADLGYSIMVTSTESQAKTIIEEHHPKVVLIDVASGNVVAPSALRAYQDLAGKTVWFVAFGPHVERDLLATAKAAGCHAVLPRSKFAAELPALMRRYFSEPPGSQFSTYDAREELSS